MLLEAVSLLLAQLNQYIHQAEGDPPDAAGPAILGNISQIDHSDIGTTLENQLVLTLVSVEEEKTLKNGSTATRDDGAGGVAYRNRPLHLNLSLLFTANYKNYQTALKRLAQVLTFFQSKQRFTAGNSPGAPGGSPISELSLTLDLLSLSLEEINNLWGSLGGKALPYAIYRARLVVIEDRRVPLAGGGLIQEIEVAGVAL